MRRVWRSGAMLAMTVWVAAACVENAPTPSPIVAPTSTAREGERGGLVRAASPPQGAFRTTPAASADVIVVALGDPVLVNGARFTSADPEDELKVEASWGDGTRDSVGCGPCRLSHVYGRAGSFPLVATIHNRRHVDRGEVTHAFRVIVDGPADPDPGPPLFCQPIHAHIGVIGSPTVVACPSGAAQFCDSVPIMATSSVQAQLACQACKGAPCTNAGGSVGDAWYFYASSRAFFVYNGQPFPPTATAAGDINDSIVTTGRWAP